MQIPDDLTDPERLLWDAMETGEAVSLLDDGTVEDRNPANGAQWGAERRVRGEALAAMLTEPSRGRRPRAARLALARITGTLDLEGLKLACPLILQSCFFDHSVNANATQVPNLALTSCHMPRLTGRQIRSRDDIDLTGLHAQYIQLDEARVGGRLNLNGAHLENPDGDALTAEGAQIHGDMFCRAGFQAEGQIRLTGARIGGELNLNGAHLKNPDGKALSADRAQIEEGLFCNDIQTDGEMRLIGAHIGGQLNLAGAHLKNPDSEALSADDAQIDGGMFCTNGFQVEGKMRLPGARIGAQLNLAGAHLKNPDSEALSADGAQIGGDMVCNDGFQVEGMMRLIGAHIGGQLNLTRAHLKNPDGKALTLDGADIKEDVLCLGGFQADGALCLTHAHIGGRLDLSQAKLSSTSGSALDLRHSTITRLVLPMTTAPQGVLDLTHARVIHLEDDWPTTAYKASLADLVYETLSPLDGQIARRLDWIARAEGAFRPQPYEQLAAALRREGHDDGAREVAIAKEEARQGTLRWPGKLRSRFLGSTVGYGYKPAQGLWWLTGLFLIDWFVFTWAKENGHLRALREKSVRPPEFHVSLYALDHVLPVIELGQRSYWSATGFFQYWQTASDLAGWLLVTVILGAVTARLVRS
jgi:hypothetical protein